MKILKDFRWGLTGERQSMAIASGRVLWRDARAELPPGAEVENLDGKWLLPSFIDGHCHILPTGLFLAALDLATASSHEEVLAAVRDFHDQHPDGWLLAVNYDQNRYPEGHLNRSQLDAIAPNRPVILRHVTGHASVANSQALVAAQVTEDVLDPAGGTFQRDAAGRLTGVLFEDAHDLVTKAMPTPTVAEMARAIHLAGESMASYGIACASDMMTGRYDLLGELDAYRFAAENGCPIRTRLYLQWKEVFGPKALPLERILERLEGADESRVRINGIKIFADGAIGSATAAIYGSYTGREPNGAIVSRYAQPVSGSSADGRPTSGQLIYNPSRLHDMVIRAHDAGYEVAVHSIGDYSTDLVLDAFEATGEPARHRLEHAMILSDAQIERIARLVVRVTFQPEFLARFGYAYQQQLGPERTAKLKRTRSVLDAGIPLSFNSDRPIVAGNPWDGIHAAENRPEGFDPAENCSRLEALLAATRGNAVANRDADMATLEPGSLADYMVLDFDPLTDNPVQSDHA
ncbi:MAG: amidohydrolase [Fimbriimonas sp.]